MSSRFPIFINCRDRLDPLRLLIDWLERAGQDEIYLLDNDSRWPPLLEYYEQTPHKVIKLEGNHGRFGVWTAAVLQKLGVRGRFVMTDPDVLPSEDCPVDVFNRFSALLDKYPNVLKVGFGLRVDDLPDTFRLKREVVDWERQFWLEEIEPGVFYADIDSTFALYRENSSTLRLAPALRTGAPYLARHLPWYEDAGRASEEEVFYRSRAHVDHAIWGRDALPDTFVAALDTQRMEPRLRDETALLMPWVIEPPTVGEREFTPWAENGWRSWNEHSPEVEFCEFVAQIVRIMAPGIVLETGVGQGYTTRRVAAVLPTGSRLVCFESDGELREGLRHLPFFSHPDRVLGNEDGPAASDFVAADLTILDSEPAMRVRELEAWHAAARDGTAVIVHDTGNGHEDSTIHAQNARAVASLRIPGIFMKNPRGSFFGIRPPRAEAAAIVAAKARADAAEASLRTLEATRSYRWLPPARRAWGRWLRATRRR